MKNYEYECEIRNAPYIRRKRSGYWEKNEEPMIPR